MRKYIHLQGYFVTNKGNIFKIRMPGDYVAIYTLKILILNILEYGCPFGKVMKSDKGRVCTPAQKTRGGGRATLGQTTH